MKKVNADQVRAQVLGMVDGVVSEANYELLVTGAGEVTIPVVANDGEEGFVTISVTVRGKNRDGAEYDGYAEAIAYQEDRIAKEQKDKVVAEAKALKQAQRDAKAKEKADKEKAKATQPE